jgi:hypothetical protein
MKTVKVGKFEYNLTSVLKKSKSEFKKAYEKINSNWEAHFDKLQTYKPSKPKKEDKDA